MGACYSNGHTELKASFGKGSEVSSNSPVEEFNKRFFEIGINYDNKFEVLEGITLLFLYWYRKHEKEMKKQRERAANDKEYDTVNIQ